MPLLLTDLDETLVDRSAALRRWATGFVATRGLPDAEVARIVEMDRHGRRSRPEFVAAVNESLRLDPPLRLDYLSDYVRGFTLDPATADALTRARAAGWRIGIVSNGEQPQLDKIARVGLGPLVDGVCVSGLEQCRKPDPRLFRLAAERAGSSLEGAWMIGDDAVADMGGADAAGIRGVWLRHGRTWPDDLSPPTAQADSFPEAVDIALSDG